MKVLYILDPATYGGATRSAQGMIMQLKEKGIVPSIVIAAGNPCKVICTLDEYRNKHEKDFLYMVSLPYEQKKQYLMDHFDLNNE